MMGVMYTDPSNTVLKHTFWLVSQLDTVTATPSDLVAEL
jgi:hypothetical protein